MKTLGRVLGMLSQYIGSAMRMPGPDSAYSDHGPRATVYALDNSGSMADTGIRPNRFIAACKAVHHHIEARRRLAYDDWAAALVFSDSAYVVCRGVPMDRADGSIANELLRLEPDGGTSFSAGLSSATTMFALAPAGHSRHLIWLSDGEDCERHAPAIADALKRRGVLIDCIGIGRTPAEVDEDYLKAIASVVDGKVRYRFISNADDLNDHFEAMATGMRRQA